jgi:hypothetical protein
MLMISIPKPFGIGDTAEVRINGSPCKLTWLNRDTISIADHEEADTNGPRPLFQTQDGPDSKGEMCVHIIAGNSKAEMAKMPKGFGDSHVYRPAVDDETGQVTIVTQTYRQDD